MLFKSFLDSPCGFRFMFDSLQLQSSCGRAKLLETELMTDSAKIEDCYEKLHNAYDSIYGEGKNSLAKLETLDHGLMCLRDITGTLARLNKDVVLDDIDLFEIKYLGLLCSSVTDMVNDLGLKDVQLPNLESVISILDPDGMKIESFYVYDSYSKDLGRIRTELKKLQAAESAGKKDGATDDRIVDLVDKEQLLESKIREELSGKLKRHSKDLYAAIDRMAALDILLAKAQQIKKMKMCFPQISSDGRTVYKGMFHPQIVDVYDKENVVALSATEKKKFVPVDIDFELEPVTIIGANMGGKTVVLKMTALNQLLFQFGFGIAAGSAVIDIKDNVMVCIGDEQNELSGLSSFAGEIKAVNQVLKSADAGDRILALIDEPARTTNPIEGTALVTALLNVLKGKKLSVLLTTHYNIAGDFFRRLRVNGLKEGKMDYRLQETHSGDIPHEAINIAESLNINPQWIAEAKKELERQKKD